MPVSISQLDGVLFLAYQELENHLTSELKERFCYDVKKTNISLPPQLVYCPDWKNSEMPYWAKVTFLTPILVKFDSISEAVNTLKNIQRNWTGYQFTQFRRMSLIQEKLPYINLKTRKFPCVIPQSPMGIFTLLDANTMIASSLTSSFLPAGQIILEEDHENPPSRAYLKMEEALIRFSSFYSVGKLPKEGQHCFDAGACPGGWTWVLRQLGCEVTAVDRAELAENLMKDSLVHFMKHDAFTLKPEDLPSFDWVFSDVICYPERLYEWVSMWLESNKVKNMICTIKMQGKTDWSIIKKFSEIPNSVIQHLCYNKHELTWFYFGKES